jgi:hypothetical protein
MTILMKAAVFQRHHFRFYRCFFGLSKRKTVRKIFEVPNLHPTTKHKSISGQGNYIAGELESEWKGLDVLFYFVTFCIGSSPAADS